MTVKSQLPGNAQTGSFELGGIGRRRRRAIDTKTGNTEVAAPPGDSSPLSVVTVLP
ncbi:MAG: hypothetical protein OXU88_06980 [Gammaproteobacteria bacterium]|nr:hypothetical protein [Gammaproteobacteria bacterium]